MQVRLNSTRYVHHELLAGTAHATLAKFHPMRIRRPIQRSGHSQTRNPTVPEQPKARKPHKLQNCVCVTFQAKYIDSGAFV